MKLNVEKGAEMALSEGGLAAKGVGPMAVQGPGGRKVTVRPKSKSKKVSLFVRPKGRGRRK